MLSDLWWMSSILQLHLLCIIIYMRALFQCLRPVCLGGLMCKDSFCFEHWFYSWIAYFRKWKERTLVNGHVVAYKSNLRTLIFVSLTMQRSEIFLYSIEELLWKCTMAQFWRRSILVENWQSLLILPISLKNCNIISYTNKLVRLVYQYNSSMDFLRPLLSLSLICLLVHDRLKFECPRNGSVLIIMKIQIILYLPILLPSFYLIQNFDLGSSSGGGGFLWHFLKTSRPHYIKQKRTK